MRPRFKRYAVYALALGLVLSSCTTARDVAVPPPEAKWEQVPDIQVGDHVVVIHKNGKKESFKVTSVGTKALYGKSANIAYVDIDSLQVRKFNGARTAWLVLGTAAGALAALYALLLISVQHEE